MSSASVIGREVPLKDGRVKVSGALRYAPDLKLPGMVHARLVTSPYAHARIESIDTAAARAVSGVASVLIAADMPPLPPGNRRRLLLARERVIFVGQPVALVLAESEAVAADGAELVQVDYDPLPAAVTIEQALADDAPLVWPGGEPGDSGEAGAHGVDLAADEDRERRSSNVAGQRHYERGDIAAGFADADVVVERTFTTAMVHQGYLEPHATVAQPDLLGGGVTLWSSTQAPFSVRQEVARVLDVSESEVRVVATPVGGGFGGKFMLYEPLVALAARHLSRPVSLVLTRMEEMLAANPDPAARLEVKLGARRDGTFTALQADLIFDGGCYPSFHAIAAVLLGSVYQVPHIDIRYRDLLTFKPSVGAYRAPGAPQTAFALESLVDEMAQALALDPLALRLQNASAPGDPMVHERPWQSMGMRQVLEALRRHSAWQQRQQSRSTGRGVGVAIGGWPGGTEPAAAACMLNRDGELHVHVGSVDLTGTSTGFALLAAEAFGVDPDQVRVIAGDTAQAPYAGAAGGSKITYTVGPAVLQAAREARQQVLAIASEEFEADPADLEIVSGQVQVRGVPDRAIPLAELAGKTMRFGGRYAPVIGHGRHADNTASPAFCAQLAEVEVDQETGQVTPVRLVLVQDVGRAINPAGIRGQMHGGAVQGLGRALYERIRYDDQGQLLTGTLMEYALPKAAQSPLQIEIEVVEVPAEHGPLGARGVGEPPVIATPAALANAITDATGRRLTDLPITPMSILGLD
ncbi:MAG: xanthine dehydrogenase family protein molybdopterin-binding subunit [Candidatus Promineifilaceae bacterium]|nr:xanthine dehydrogenase family protein molybdopterin-binding subunit [Candidatus Promineifilaceae bacterium]